MALSFARQRPMKCCSRRRFTSRLIHSRACWLEEYSTAGRDPSGTSRALWVTFSAISSRP